MTLRQLDLPTPADLNHRWAAMAAQQAATNGRSAWIDGELRYWDDDGGNWVAMAVLPLGRAVLFGLDLEYSETCFGETGHLVGKQETDLLADAPGWWGEALDRHLSERLGSWVGFAYGWEDGQWRRASYDLADGYADLQPAVAEHDLAVGVTHMYIEQEGERRGLPIPDEALVDVVVTAGPQVTEEQLRAIALPGWDVAKGVATAHAFAL